MQGLSHFRSNFLSELPVVKGKSLIVIDCMFPGIGHPTDKTFHFRQVTRVKYLAS